MIPAATTSALSLISSTPSAGKATASADPSVTILASANGVSSEVDASKKAFSSAVFNASLNIRETEGRVVVGPDGALAFLGMSLDSAVSAVKSEIDAVGRGEGTFGRSTLELEAMVRSFETVAAFQALNAEMIADYNSPEQEAARATALKASAESMIAAYNEHQTFMGQLLKAGLLTEDRTKGLDEAYAYNKGIYDDLVKAGY